MLKLRDRLITTLILIVAIAAGFAVRQAIQPRPAPSHTGICSIVEAPPAAIEIAQQPAESTAYPTPVQEIDDKVDMAEMLLFVQVILGGA